MSRCFADIPGFGQPLQEPFLTGAAGCVPLLPGRVLTAPCAAAPRGARFCSSLRERGQGLPSAPRCLHVSFVPTPHPALAPLPDGCPLPWHSAAGQHSPSSCALPASQDAAGEPQHQPRAPLCPPYLRSLLHFLLLQPVCGQVLPVLAELLQRANHLWEMRAGSPRHGQTSPAAACPEPVEQWEGSCSLHTL